MKRKNKFKLIALSFLSISISSTLFLTSCGSISNPIKLKIMTNASNSNNPIHLNDLKQVNSSPNKAILGDSSINNGNYILIYGSIAGSTRTLSFRDWLSGGSINNGGGITINPKINANFLNAFLNVAELNSGENKVEVLLFIDNPEFSINDNIFSKLNYDPYEKYTQEILLKEYNYNYKIENNLPQTSEDEIVEFDLLPESYKKLENQFIRIDDLAISYRNFVNYTISIRPNISPIVGEDNKLSGGIAFSKNKKPSLLGSLNSSDGTSIETNGTVKSLYKYYLDKDYI